MAQLHLTDFPLLSFDKIRYADTDRQGHVNNAVFSTFVETGRVEFLYNPETNVLSENASFVIAKLELQLLNEMTWPGRVDIGTGILRVGNSSITIYQQLFQGEICTAIAKTVIVQTKDGKSYPLSDEAKTALNKWVINLETKD